MTDCQMLLPLWRCVRKHSDRKLENMEYLSENRTKSTDIFPHVGISVSVLINKQPNMNLNVKKCIDKMMEICGYNARYHHLIQMGDYPWYNKYTCTKKEASAFRKWFFKTHKGNRYMVESSYSGFWLMWGLREI